MMMYLRLIIILVIIHLFLHSCKTIQPELLVKYRGLNVDNLVYEDSLKIRHVFSSDFIELDVFYEDTLKKAQLKFEQDGIYCSISDNSFKMFIDYNKKSVFSIENPCQSLFPLMGASNGSLNSKYYKIEGKSYLVNKYYIEREDTSFRSGVGVYFLEDFGFLIFRFERGNYLMPNEVIGKTNIPWKEVIAEIRKEPYSGLQPTPPPPPPPPPSH